MNVSACVNMFNVIHRIRICVEASPLGPLCHGSACIHMCGRVEKNAKNGDIYKHKHKHKYSFSFMSDIYLLNGRQHYRHSIL